MPSEIPEVELRRELAAKVGCVTREDYCTLADITPGTEEAHRKRGLAPPYIIIGRSILYPVAQLAEHLKSKVRDRARPSAGSVL